MSKPLVTLVIVPRERFSLALESLDQVYAETSTPFRLVYVDAGSPRRVRRGLAARARERGFQLIRDDRYLNQNEARNLALPRVDTRYTVFLDNDVLVTPGWLDHLVRCAEETGAGICGPIQLIGPLEDGVIHLAGGITRIEERDGRRSLFDAQQLAGVRLGSLRSRPRRGPVDHVEFHCMLVRTQLLREIGPLDEAMMSVHEYTDLCLMARERGARIFLEPEAVVTYLPPERLAWSDLSYFALRWSEPWTRRTLERFAQKWRLDTEHSGLAPAIGFTRWRRRFLWQPFAGLSRRLDGPVGRALKERLLRPPAEALQRLALRRTEARRRGR